MDNDTFWYLVKNQRKWAEGYRMKQSIRKEIRKIINRKQIGRGGAELRANILNDLNSSLYANEITITENHEGRGFDVRFFGEHHSIPKLNTEERK